MISYKGVASRGKITIFSPVRNIALKNPPAHYLIFASYKERGRAKLREPD